MGTPAGKKAGGLLDGVRERSTHDDDAGSTFESDDGSSKKSGLSYKIAKDIHGKITRDDNLHLPFVGLKTTARTIVLVGFLLMSIVMAAGVILLAAGYAGSGHTHHRRSHDADYYAALAAQGDSTAHLASRNGINGASA